jgi:hypothetical protein
MIRPGVPGTVPGRASVTPVVASRTRTTPLPNV